jgi:hypothetical protein
MARMTGASLASAGLTALAFVAAACGDGGNGVTATATPAIEATTTPAATATPLASRTGMPEVDTVLDALFSGDSQAVENLVSYTSIPCEVEPVGIGAPPACGADEPEGTPAEVFPKAQCEGYYVRPEDMGDTLTTLTTPGPQLAAVYRGSIWPPGEYVAIYTGVGDPRRAEFVYAIAIQEGRIVGTHGGCAMTPDTFVDFFQLQERLLPPPADR